MDSDSWILIPQTLFLNIILLNRKCLLNKNKIQSQNQIIKVSF